MFELELLEVFELELLEVFELELLDVFGIFGLEVFELEWLRVCLAILCRFSFTARPALFWSVSRVGIAALANAAPTNAAPAIAVILNVNLVIIISCVALAWFRRVNLGAEQPIQLSCPMQTR